ncbi:MAG: hypothetical protein QOF30_461 [Acidimicrobiaceae bacterium]|nr:hypothetical protein [Acidimicrobiaceae bacterium]
MNSFLPTAELDLATEAFRSAHGRFLDGLNARSIEAWYASLTETLWWIVALDDHYNQSYKTRYERLRNNDPHGRVILGLRFARNLAGHELISVLEDPGEGQPEPAGCVNLSQLRWRDFETPRATQQAAGAAIRIPDLPRGQRRSLCYAPLQLLLRPRACSTDCSCVHVGPVIWNPANERRRLQLLQLSKVSKTSDASAPNRAVRPTLLAVRCRPADPSDILCGWRDGHSPALFSYPLRYRRYGAVVVTWVKAKTKTRSKNSSSGTTVSRPSRPSCSSSGTCSAGGAAVFVVGDVIAPGGRASGDGNVGHEVFVVGAVPVLLTVASDMHVARSDLDHFVTA